MTDYRFGRRVTAMGALLAATAVLAPTAIARPAATPAGNAVNGKKIFVSTACGACHTLKAAGTKSTIGANLDLKKPTFAKVVSILNTGKGSMQSYKALLSASQIKDVATFISTAKH
ncbi:MAG: cytochrome c [Actinobacteria bacterium]|uniref:Unannotated protein n=1 Tax=freshwater metagenome TaxID=449393 RepID=A0A6J6NJU1_9ZZZZ|nr:cytochrome c [Actinomycetota bacterium]